jgi:predicted GH43/DUF377 family glycosyl hydrolase
MPTEPFEIHGFFGNVVFSNGLVEKDDKLYIYYGAADESVGVAITDKEYLLSTLSYETETFAQAPNSKPLFLHTL